MHFTYAYKTSDGKRHEAAIEAESREAVFESLRAKGIKAIKVVADDGSKANGAAIPSSRKRRLLPPALAGAIAATTVFLVFDVMNRRNDAARERSAVGHSIIEIGERVASPRTRRQIGLASITNEVPLDRIFSHSSEIFLAQFSEPGQAVSVDVRGNAELEEDFNDAMGSAIVISPSDSLEVAELKMIVAGIKEEAKMMLASGKTFKEAVDYFVAQQHMEEGYRESILSQDIPTEDKNRLLSSLGLRTIPNPREAE